MARHEDTYCRRPAAAAINKYDNTRWKPAINATQGGTLTYISGHPDGEVLGQKRGLLCYLEYKAFFGSLFMGDPEKQDITSGFHYHQRHWYDKMAAWASIPYYILVWGYPEREPMRVMQANASLFLVTPDIWYATEAAIAPRKTISLTSELEREKAYKDKTLDIVWAGYRLQGFNDLPTKIFNNIVGGTVIQGQPS